MSSTVEIRPVTDAAALVSAGWQLIGVREAEEFADGSLPGARNIPLGQLSDRIGENGLEWS